MTLDCCELSDPSGVFPPDLPPAFCSGSPGIVGIEAVGELDCESPADEEGMEGGRGVPLLLDLPSALCSGRPGIVGIEELGTLDCESPLLDDGIEGGRGMPLLDEGDDDGLVGKFILGIDVLGGVGMAEGGVGMGLGGELVGEGIGWLLGDGVLGGEGLD